MVVWCKEIRVFATELDRLFQERQHRREVIRRPRSRPGIIGGGAECSGASYVVWRDLERFFEVAPCNTDQARVIRVWRKTLSKRCERVEQPTKAGSTSCWCASLFNVAPWRLRAGPPPLGM